MQVKEINMPQESLAIYLKVAKGALNKLDKQRGQYKTESVVKELEEQLDTIAMYLEFENRQELIKYLQQ